LKEAHHATEEDVFKHVLESVHAFLARSDTGTQLVKVELHVGHPFVELLEACQRRRAGLIVLGTRGTEHGPNQIGAIAAKCVRKAPADVLLVREGKHTPFQHITTCVDLSETSAKALRAARAIAQDDGASLDCLYVYQSALALSLDYGGFVPPLPVDSGEAAAAWKKELDEFVQPLLRTAEGLKWQTLVVERVNIREAILEHIRESKTDLVVLGTRGKTDLRTLIMGTTAEKIVTHAPCSVLAVKPEDFVSPVLQAELPPPIVPFA
jgi:universal stress protein E